MRRKNYYTYNSVEYCPLILNYIVIIQLIYLLAALTGGATSLPVLNHLTGVFLASDSV